MVWDLDYGGMAVTAVMKARVAMVQGDLVRADGRIERHCEHGVGHTVGHIRGYITEDWETVHGCDGCCKGWLRQGER